MASENETASLKSTKKTEPLKTGRFLSQMRHQVRHKLNFAHNQYLEDILGISKTEDDSEPGKSSLSAKKLYTMLNRSKNDSNKLRKTFSKFYRRYYDLISKFQVGLKSLLRQGLSEPDFYGDLVFKLKKIVGSNNFSAQFIKIISHYKKIGYNINVLQQTACLVVNPITVGNFAFLFNCTPVGRTSDSMMVPT